MPPTFINYENTRAKIMENTDYIHSVTKITFQQIKENPAAYIEEFGVHGVQDKCCIIILNGAGCYFNEGQVLVRENNFWVIK